MSHNRVDLTTGNVRAHLIRLTIPMIWGIAAIISFQLVDTYYVSLLGTVPLAAMTFTFPVTFFVFSIIMGFGIATSSVVSRLIGEKREEDVKRVTTHSLLLVLGVGLLMAVIGIVFGDLIYEAMGAREDIRPLIHEYMSIWFLGVPFMVAPFVGNSAIRAAGSTFAPAVIMVGSAVFNAALAPVLVFGLWGFPRLELQGAAIATVLANLLAMLAGFYVLKIRRQMLLPFNNLQFAKLKDSARRLMFIAMGAGVTSAIGPLVNSVIIALMSKYGTEAVAAFGVATRIEAFAFIILMALAVGMGPIIGQNYGAQSYERVRQTLRQAIGFSVLWCLGIGVLLIGFAQPLAEIFSEDPAVVYYTKLSFLIIAPSYMFHSLVNGWSSAFNAMGMPRISVSITVIKMLLLMIPAVIIGASLGGPMGIFMAIAIVNIITGIGVHIWSKTFCSGFDTRLALKTP